MNVELIQYTPDGINLIARLARSTRMNELEQEPEEISSISAECGQTAIVTSEEYEEWCKKNEKFVKTLIKVKHFGVLEHVSFTFHISEISRALTHQLVRHRMASYLQMSNRHAKPEKNGYVEPPIIKETSELTPEEASGKQILLYDMYTVALGEAYKFYEELIKHGMKIEDARYVLPPAFFTHITFTANLRTIIHFLELRLAHGSQWEIKELAVKIFDLIYEIYPICLEELKPLRDEAEDVLNKKM